MHPWASEDGKWRSPWGGEATKERKQQKHPRRGAIFCPELAHTLTGISRHYTTPLLNLHFKGLLRLYQKRNQQRLKNFHFMRTTGLQKFFSSWLLYRKSNRDNNFRAAVKDLGGELQQTSGKCKQEGATKREKKSIILSSEAENSKLQIPTKFKEGFYPIWNYNKKWLHCWIFLWSNNWNKTISHLWSQMWLYTLNCNWFL